MKAVPAAGVLPCVPGADSPAARRSPLDSDSFSAPHKDLTGFADAG